MGKTLGIFVVFLLCVALPPVARAVSWSPEAAKQEEKIEKGIKGVGGIVCLFQSGTTDVRTELRVNDILGVFRENRSHQMKEVGKIKILSYAGADYLKGEIVEGEAGPGDIAKKGDAAGLVISSEDACKEKAK